jgi:hypothetical protein
MEHYLNQALPADYVGMAAVVGICAQYNAPRALDHRFFSFF